MSEDKRDFEFGGSIAKTTYSTYFDSKFSISGNPTSHDLEKYLRDPQGNIDGISALSKYHYYKNGTIMRTVNIMRDFGITKINKEYKGNKKRVKKILDEYDKRINTKKLAKDMLFEMALTGNVSGYDRDGEYVDLLPLSVIEVSDLIVNGKQQLLFDHGKFEQNYNLLSKEDVKKIKEAYPEEVRKAKPGDKYTPLNIENTFFIKNNSSRYEKYGVTFLLPAFSELAQKNLMKEAEKSTTAGIIDQIFHIKVGDKDNPPKNKDVEYYNNLFNGIKGSARAATPYNVSLEWVAPDVSIFGEQKFKEVDKDLMSALGVSITLLRGDGGGNYSDGMINMAGLIRTIDSMREDIPSVIEELYAKELERHGIKKEHTPTVTFSDIEIDRTAKYEMMQWLFQSAGLPYEILFEQLGFDYENIKSTREDENKYNTEDIFKLRQQPFQGNQSNVEDKGGRPEKSETERTSDKNQSNNDQPRTGIGRIKEG